MTWTGAAAQYVLRTTSCPRCDVDPLSHGVCQNCGADLSGPAGAEVWEASQQVAVALRARQSLVDALPTVARITAARAPQPQPVAPRQLPSTGSSVTLQSVLAVAGAGLFGVAAIVFTFLNPDLTDFATRTAIIGAITIVMLGFAWLLARKVLQFSAESVGALGVVFVTLDIWALAQGASTAGGAFAFAAVGTFVSSILLIGISVGARIRTWLWAGIVLLLATPALIGYAVGTIWSTIVGHLAVGLVALVAHLLARRIAPRFGSTLRTDRVTIIVLQSAVVAVVVLQLTLIADTALGVSAVLGMLALTAALASRTSLPAVWAVLAGAFATAAAAVLPMALNLAQPVWYLALAPAAAALVFVALTALRRRYATRGALVIASAAAIPATALAGLAVLVTVFGGVLATLPRDELLRQVASILGLVALTAGLAGAARLTHRAGIVRAALWSGAATLLAVSAWVGFARPTQVAVALLLAVALVFAVTRLPGIRTAARDLRAPLIVGAHLLVLLAALISLSDQLTSVIAGVVIVAVIALLAFTLPTWVRPVHVAIAYGYALATFARALDLANIETIAILCLTTSLAAVCALVVTQVHRIRTGYWYAVLAVTGVPFAIGIVSVLIERSGWTALSTGLIFLLALTLTTTRRAGLTLALRALAAGLLVPALAVVIISLGAQVLAVSASPITLPVIAVIVAVTLPSTGLIGAALIRHGIADATARAARIAIEISTLVTAALAVLLAVVRAAAGLETTFLVLMIIGVGAAATGFYAGRRYAWVVAAASFTGAMWCVWALAGITAIEPYLLPPALAAALVGAIATARGLPAKPLYTAGLAAAAAPSLALLAVAGTPAGEFAWRTAGLLAGGLLLLVLARVRKSLRIPTLVVAIVAASAGTVQAIHSAQSADLTTVLALSAGSTLLAIVAGTLLARELAPGARWVYVPATLYLVVAPIVAVQHTWFSIITLLTLTIVVLLVMLATVVIARRRPTALPPVWLLFAVAWCTAVAGWSQRELRVEAFSLPLGFALLLAGIIAIRSLPGDALEVDAPVVGAPLLGRGITRWPVGFTGSWALLAPGILATLLPSILATGTDPLTHRAILVIALALIAILIGSVRKLAAPFILGIIALPIENVVVFAVQIGRSIGALPWWITLATAGAVLLVIAVTSERRVGADRGVAARLRDLT